MALKIASRLEAYFEEAVGDNLRSIVKYEPESAEIVYIRDDVAETYSDEGIADAIDDARMDAFSAPLYEDSFSADHGELTCLVQYFENAVEMNFVLDGMAGTAVGLDIEACQESRDLVTEARQIVLEERGR